MSGSGRARRSTSGRQAGHEVLFAVPWPPQGIFTNRTLNGVGDMKGLKWRAYSPATAKVAELVGAQPVTVQAAEVSQALATGVIDSYMSSGATGFDSKTYEHIQNFYDTRRGSRRTPSSSTRGLRRARQAGAGRAAESARRRGEPAGSSRRRRRLVRRAAEGQGHSRSSKPSEQLMADCARSAT